MHKKIGRFLLGFIKSENQTWLQAIREILILIAIIVFIRTFVFVIFAVEGASMCPTLNQFEDKCSHSGGKSEFIFGNRFHYLFNKPQRGDIVVFHPPSSEEKGFFSRDFYIKRIIGIGGDVIEIQDGNVFVSNENHESILLEEDYLSSANKHHTETFEKNIFRVPEGSYFVMGDNRNESLDSRSCFNSFLGCNLDNSTPFITDDSIKAKAGRVLWPLRHYRPLVRPEIFSQISSS